MAGSHHFENGWPGRALFHAGMIDVIGLAVMAAALLTAAMAAASARRAAMR